MTDIDGTLFEQLRPRLKAISVRIVGSEAEAEDVVQDCFLKWHGMEQAALATPAAWLTTVVQHQSIDRLRKRVRDAAAAHVASEVVPGAAPALPEDGLLRRAELSAALARLLDCTPQERLALVLHEVLECEHADVAAALGTSVANARQLLARARKRLLAHGHVPNQLAEEKLNRDLVRRFQAAINNMDAPTVVTLLTDMQPMQVCANDASYAMAMTA